MQVVMNTPSVLIGAAPPVLDCPWLGNGAQPLGTSPLGSTITVDASLLSQLLDMGFVIATETE